MTSGILAEPKAKINDEAIPCLTALFFPETFKILFLIYSSSEEY